MIITDRDRWFQMSHFEDPGLLARQVEAGAGSVAACRESLQSEGQREFPEQPREQSVVVCSFPREWRPGGDAPQVRGGGGGRVVF